MNTDPRFITHCNSNADLDFRMMSRRLSEILKLENSYRDSLSDRRMKRFSQILNRACRSHLGMTGRPGEYN